MSLPDWMVGPWQPYLVMTAIMVVVGVAGGLATDVGPWYRELRKPSWQPPDWLFGPMWTAIYIFIIASVGQVWKAAPPEAHAAIVWVTAVNLVLNIAWSFLFFKFRSPPWALVEVVPLWLSIVAMMVVFAPYHERSAWLLIPYLAWVSVAAYLNLTIVRLNRGGRGGRGDEDPDAGGTDDGSGRAGPTRDGGERSVS